MLQTQVETARARLVEAAGDLPENVRDLWRDTIKAVDAAIKSIEPARGKVERIWGNFDYTLPARQERSTALVRELNDSVTAQLDKAERLLSEIAWKLQEDVQPARPSDASESAILDRKRDIIGYLSDERRIGRVVELVADFTAKCIRDGDDLTAYVLCSGPLEWFYLTHDVDRRSLRSAIFRALRAMRSEPIAGEALLHAYEATEEDDTSWKALRRDIASLVGEVAGVAAYGLRKTAAHSPGWDAANIGNPRRVENPGTPDTTRGMNAPERENLNRRLGSAVPADLNPSYPTNAAK